MVAHEFFFQVEMSSLASAGMLSELTAQVLECAGCSGEAVPGLVDALQSALARSTANGEGRCDVLFRARGRELEIVVFSSAGRIWQTSRTIP